MTKQKQKPVTATNMIAQRGRERAERLVTGLAAFLGKLSKDVGHGEWLCEEMKKAGIKLNGPASEVPGQVPQGQVRLSEENVDSIGRQIIEENQRLRFVMGAVNKALNSGGEESLWLRAFMRDAGVPLTKAEAEAMAKAEDERCAAEAVDTEAKATIGEAVSHEEQNTPEAIAALDEEHHAEAEAEEDAAALPAGACVNCGKPEDEHNPEVGCCGSCREFEAKRIPRAPMGNGCTTCDLDPACPEWEPHEGCRREACDVGQDEECPVGDCPVEEDTEGEGCPCPTMVQAVHLNRATEAASQPGIGYPCPACGQHGDVGGEYPCPACGIPTLHDSPEPAESEGDRR